MTIRAIGYGAGDRDPEKHPNVLRLIVGEDGDAATERIVEIACEIDDMNPQLFGPLMDRLHAAGALDVFYAPVQMKKGRPGVLITVQTTPSEADALEAILFQETPTLGVRCSLVQRTGLPRESREVETRWGRVAGKVASLPGGAKRFTPEYDACAKIAIHERVSIAEVMAAASEASSRTASA